MSGGGWRPGPERASRGGRGKGTLRAPCHKGAHPIPGAPPLRPHHLPKAPSPRPIISEIVNFGGPNLQSTVVFKDHLQVQRLMKIPGTHGQDVSWCGDKVESAQGWCRGQALRRPGTGSPLVTLHNSMCGVPAWGANEKLSHRALLWASDVGTSYLA